MRKKITTMFSFILIFIILLSGCGYQRPTTTSNIVDGTFEYAHSYENFKEFESDHEYVFAMSSNFIIYDRDCLYMFFGDENIEIEDFTEAIKSNPDIPDKYEDLFIAYCSDYINNCPEADRRVLYKNISDIKVDECNEMEMIMNSWSEDALACYVNFENRLCLPIDEVFEKGTWGYQLLYHELSHAARLYRYEAPDGVCYQVTDGGPIYSETILEELLNTIFSVSLLGYEKRDIAYQFFGNIMTMMIECMDNYSPADYINHSQSYFIKCLNEYTGRDDAVKMMDMIDVMYDDYYTDKKFHFQSYYYPVYDYLADIYYKQHITPDMSRAEAREVADELVEKISFDVPEEFHVKWSRFYHHANQYLRQIK